MGINKYTGYIKNTQTSAVLESKYYKYLSTYIHIWHPREAIKKSARIKTLSLKEGGGQFENLIIF